MAPMANDDAAGTRASRLHARNSICVPANRWQLIDAGVPEKQIDVSDLCTACRTDLLFSYRREGAKNGADDGG